jgi:hypothetical protein
VRSGQEAGSTQQVGGARRGERREHGNE